MPAIRGTDSPTTGTRSERECHNVKGIYVCPAGRPACRTNFARPSAQGHRNKMPQQGDFPPNSEPQKTSVGWPTTIAVKANFPVAESTFAPSCWTDRAGSTKGLERPIYGAGLLGMAHPPKTCVERLRFRAHTQGRRSRRGAHSRCGKPKATSPRAERAQECEGVATAEGS